MPAAKQYVVRVPFRTVDPKTGKSTKWEVGKPYTGPTPETYAAGIDHNGPLIVEGTPTDATPGKEN